MANITHIQIQNSVKYAQSDVLVDAPEDVHVDDVDDAHADVVHVNALSAA